MFIGKDVLPITKEDHEDLANVFMDVPHVLLNSHSSGLSGPLWDLSMLDDLFLVSGRCQHSLACAQRTSKTCLYIIVLPCSGYSCFAESF